MTTGDRIKELCISREFYNLTFERLEVTGLRSRTASDLLQIKKRATDRGYVEKREKPRTSASHPIRRETNEE